MEKKISIKIDDNDEEYMTDRQLKRFIISIQDKLIKCAKIIKENDQSFSGFKTSFYADYKKEDLEILLWKENKGRFYCAIDDPYHKSIAAAYLEMVEEKESGEKESEK